ncbi:MAG: ribosome recycling factor [Gemmataceae bacterium]
MTSDEILLDAEERMEKAVKYLSDELRGIRTGRANPALVETLRVECYGSTMQLRQVAAISAPDAHQLLIRPYDPTTLKDIECAIQTSELGLTPQSDGKVIRLTIPPMSGEQRQKLVARVKKLTEEAKVAIRNIRRDANKHFDQEQKAKTMSEDECERGKKQVQELTDDYEARAQALADRKTAEILEE